MMVSPPWNALWSKTKSSSTPRYNFSSPPGLHNLIFWHFAHTASTPTAEESLNKCLLNECVSEQWIMFLITSPAFPSPQLLCSNLSTWSFMLASFPSNPSFMWQLELLSSSTILKHLGFPRWRNSKESTCQCRRCKRCGFDPWVEMIPWSRNGNPLQYSCLEDSMDRGDWQATVHGVTKSLTWLSAHTTFLSQYQQCQYFAKNKNSNTKSLDSYRKNKVLIT